ncbi:MAG: hypothetical protein ACRD04_13005 [Terriglobales bacterium]
MASRAPDEPAPRPVGHDQIGDSLQLPILRFHLSGEVEHLRRQDAWWSGTGPSSTTLVKHPDLRVVLVSMRGGERMPEHRTAARITVQALSGHIRLHLPSGVEDLPAGHLLVLDHELHHDVEALEDSAFLLTLAWPTDENCP